MDEESIACILNFDNILISKMAANMAAKSTTAISQLTNMIEKQI